jgi:hypothetical protein
MKERKYLLPFLANGTRTNCCEWGCVAFSNGGAPFTKIFILVSQTYYAMIKKSVLGLKFDKCLKFIYEQI